MPQWLISSVAQWLRRLSHCATEPQEKFIGSVAQCLSGSVAHWLTGSLAYYWRIRNTFVEVVPGHVNALSINSPGLRRSSSAPPHEVQLLDLGIMVDTGSPADPSDVPDPGAPGAMSDTDILETSCEASDPTTPSTPWATLV